MKVKIKNYSTYFGPYQLCEKLFFWMMEEDKYGAKQRNDRLDKITEWYADTWLGEFHAKWAGKFASWQDDHRASVKLKPYDTWNMDSTLAYIVLPMLKQLKDQKHGAPMVDLEDRPKHLVPPLPQNPYDTDQFHFEAWDWVMDEMIFAFNSKLEDWEDQFHSGESDILWVPVDKDGNTLGPGKRLGEKEDKPEGLHAWEMRKGPNDTSHWDKEGSRKYQERISNGFRLFGKYYEGLWD